MFLFCQSRSHIRKQVPQSGDAKPGLKVTLNLHKMHILFYKLFFNFWQIFGIPSMSKVAPDWRKYPGASLDCVFYQLVKVRYLDFISRLTSFSSHSLVSMENRKFDLYVKT